MKDIYGLIFYKGDLGIYKWGITCFGSGQEVELLDISISEYKIVEVV